MTEYGAGLGPHCLPGWCSGSSDCRGLSCPASPCDRGPAGSPRSSMGCPSLSPAVWVWRDVRFLCPALSVSGEVPTAVWPSSTDPCQPHWHAAMRFRVSSGVVVGPADGVGGPRVKLLCGRWRRFRRWVDWLSHAVGLYGWE